MASSPVLSKSPLNLQSTKQALNILRDLREKRKKQNPATIYELVKSIHALFRKDNSKKGDNHLTISSEEYLGSNRQSIEDMLLLIKQKITDFIETGKIDDINPQQQHKQQKKDNNKNLQLMEASLAKKQEQILKLTQQLKVSEHQSKTMQIKLLNNMKRLSIEVQQKDAQLIQLKKILNEKEEEFDSLTRLNQKQHRKVRKLEEDVYDLQMELQAKNEELQAERQCADMLQKKVSKLLQQETKNTNNQDIERSCYEKISEKTQTGIQTQPTNTNDEQNQQKNEQQNSLNSSFLTQSKQNKYIESIERLTFELGQAYNRINELTRQNEESGQCRTVETIGSEHINIEVSKNKKTSSSIKNQQQNKVDKPKSKSSYFSKFWK